jgi:hypothetical protein
MKLKHLRKLLCQMKEVLGLTKQLALICPQPFQRRWYRSKISSLGHVVPKVGINPDHLEWRSH